jgi:hypothetical protein
MEIVKIIPFIKASKKNTLQESQPEIQDTEAV